MTRPDMLLAERTGYGPWQQEESPAETCEECGEGIYEGEDFYDIGPWCESCAYIRVFTNYRDGDGEGAPACCGCGEAIGEQALHFALPDGEGDWCMECFVMLKRTAWAA